MVHHYKGCWDCDNCRSGWAQMCEEVKVSVYGANDHGAHAKYMKVPAATLVPLDDRLSFSAGAAISCGTGTAWGALVRMGLSGRDTIAIFGQGPVGLSATQLAVAQGATVIALDVDPARLAVAKAFGAHHVINPRDGNAVAAIKDLTHGKGAHMSLETAGANVAGKDALACVRQWGTACFVGIGTEVSFNVRAFLSRQIRILTSWTMSIQGQKDCADFIIDRGIDVDALFTHRWTLDQAEEAYRIADAQSSGKGVFLMG